ncbi:hypothetical protein B0H17DRAFT_1183084 [Mycena rosella]|uniref:Uncharacterized protein n=1 Tax=Mycena rosella TaxID=1033263 RepID=A0AAD7D1P7_MYCRO|nr:hypothetical protein B0H17DRAFT_1183084 [Mycena rosella]
MPRRSLRCLCHCPFRSGQCACFMDLSSTPVSFDRERLRCSTRTTPALRFRAQLPSHTFESVVIGLGLITAISIEKPTAFSPAIGCLAVAEQGTGVRSRLDSGTLMPSAAQIQQLRFCIC